LNVWISAKGLQDDKFTFPYKAKTSEGIKEFKNMSDVEDELVRTAYESERQGFNIGEAVWLEHLYFCNTSDLESGTPPYESLDKTPANFKYKLKALKRQRDRLKG